MISARDLAFLRAIQRSAAGAPHPCVAKGAPRAACRDYDPELWFPGAGQDSTFAKAVCQGCPLKAACLSWSLAPGNSSLPGVWGGVGDVDRRKLHRKQDRPAAAASGQVAA